MRSLTRILTILMVLNLVLTACGPMDGEPAPTPANSSHTGMDIVPVTSISESDRGQLVTGNTLFAFDLYQALGNQKGNLFFSPYSISVALGMTYAGARGQTEAEMAETLHYLLPQSHIHSAFAALNQDLVNDEKEEGSFQMHIANALWGQKGYEFLEEFLYLKSRVYGAGLEQLDFAKNPTRARKTINRWVSQQTNKRIQDLIPPGALTELTRLVLTNAIYFDAKWTLPFDKVSTQDKDFALLSGGSVQVPMMANLDTYNYTEGDGYQAIELEYEDSTMAAIFVLPAKGRFDDIESTFSAGMVDTIRQNLAPHSVALGLPKFSFESQFGLSDILVAMGMPSAFFDADFSGMTGDRALAISEVLHKAFVVVDEEGTEAAAATAVIMLESAAPMDEPIMMTFDRPFLFLIHDQESGAVLFVGRVLDPRS